MTRFGRFMTRFGRFMTRFGRLGISRGLWLRLGRDHRGRRRARFAEVRDRLDRAHPDGRVGAAGKNRRRQHEDRNHTGRRQRHLPAAKSPIVGWRDVEAGIFGQRRVWGDAVKLRCQALVKVGPELITHSFLAWFSTDDNEAGASSGNTSGSPARSVRIFSAAIRSLLLTVRSEVPIATAISRLL